MSELRDDLKELSYKYRGNLEVIKLIEEVDKLDKELYLKRFVDKLCLVLFAVYVATGFFMRLK